MRNIKAEVKGQILTITINLGENLGPSKSGKTILIATTEGNTRLHTDQGEVSLGVNCYKAPK